MRYAVLLSLILPLTASIAQAHETPDEETLATLMSHADVIVSGEFINKPEQTKNRPSSKSTARYRADFLVESVLKAPGDSPPLNGMTLRVQITKRIPKETTSYPDVLSPELPVVLFLDAPSEEGKRRYRTIDPVWAVQPKTVELFTRLKESLAPPMTSATIPILKPLIRITDPNRETERPVVDRDRALELAREYLKRREVDLAAFKFDKANVSTYSPPGTPTYWLVEIPHKKGGERAVSIAGIGEKTVWSIDSRSPSSAETSGPAPRIALPFNIAGPWRLFLPAGYEYEIKLTPLGGDLYRLEPKSFTFGGVYVLHNKRLTSIETHSTEEVRFGWDIQTAYLIRLDETTNVYGGNYENAILFRANPASTAQE